VLKPVQGPIELWDTDELIGAINTCLRGKLRLSRCPSGLHEYAQVVTPIDVLHFARGRLNAQRAAKAVYGGRLAPDFPMFDFVGTAEGGLSRVIAWLLDPGGTHAQGARFLAAFLERLGLDDEWMSSAPKARVWTEMSTGTLADVGYLDILIRLGSRSLAIENKPSAPDQPRQVDRYLNSLAENCPAGHCLLYVSGSGDGPSALSIDEERAETEIARGTLIVRGYSALIPWLDVCVSVCRAPSVAVAVEGLIGHIREEFIGVSDVYEALDLATAVCADPAMLDATLALLEAEQPIRGRILARFQQTVRDRIADRNHWHVIRSDFGPERHSAFLIGFAPATEVGFGFQFDKPRYSSLFYGVASEQGRPIPARPKTALKRFLESASGTDYWPVWKSVGPNDRYFTLARHADREFWLAAYDGRLAEMLISFVADAEAALRRAGLWDAIRSL
jgi:hypothetical protein